MVTVNYFILDLKTRETFISSKSSAEFRKTFNLPKDGTYDIGIDQSHTCTGIAIKDLDNGILIMIEVVNFGMSKEHYRNNLKAIIKAMCEDRNIRYMIMEEPLGYVTGRRNRCLTQLKHSLKELPNESESIARSTFSSIAVSSWRSKFIPKDSKFDRRSKTATVQRVLELFPETDKFKSVSATDKDSFEAVGILLGYMDRHDVDDSETVKIVGQKETRKQAFTLFFFVNNVQEDTKEVMSDLNSLSSKIGNPKMKIFNEEETLYHNAKMCLEDDCSITIVTRELDKLSIAFRFEEKSYEKLLLMVVINRKKLTDNLYDYLSYKYKNNEIYY